MRSALRLGLVCGRPQQSRVCLDSNRRPPVVSKQLPSLQMDGWKCRAMSDRMWTENLVVATAPRYCGTVSRCFDLVWYASPSALGRSLLPSVCCAWFPQLKSGWREVVPWRCPAGEKRRERSKKLR